ncbi:type II toxin-antitoxin system RnlB family antitoxin [Bacteroides acidifaciens]|uniref:type II toxin-antitoxin system RnlB family antitoxin n=1 Tax=Bacteroides acidifaciens TaxID=85831 RepID=UPI00248B0ED5|nr:type II toxin-antitoxin system RnlB family antitoxin [Bacteroides acidifaciens]
MENYEIATKKNNRYRAVIYSVSYNNPIHDVFKISELFKLKTYSRGFILFDLLLSNGDNFNRFVEAYFDGNEIVASTLKVIKLKDQKFLKDINSYYKTHLKFLNNSVLSPSENSNMQKGNFKN